MAQIDLKFPRQIWKPPTCCISNLGNFYQVAKVNVGDYMCGFSHFGINAKKFLGSN